MPDFRVDVLIDPRQAQLGAKTVIAALGRIESKADSLRLSLARAMGGKGMFGGVQVGARGAITALGDMAGKATATGKAVQGFGSKLDGVGAKAFSLGRLLPTVFALGTVVAAIKLLANFEQEMATVRAVTSGTVEQMTILRSEALKLGEGRFGPTEVAKGMVLLGRAGLSTRQILESLPGVLDLAQAGALDVSTAADITISSLNGFRLATAETARVVDVLALAANSSNSSVQSIGDALSYVAPIAAGVNIQLEETTAAIAALSDAGLQGSVAGTGLRRIISELEAPTTRAQVILGSLGIKAEDVAVSTVGLTKALQTLHDAGVDTGLALEIFGDRGGPAFEVLSANIPKVEAMTKKLKDAGGVAAKTAAIMNDNLGAELIAVGNSMKALTIDAASSSNAILGLEFAGEVAADGIRLLRGSLDRFASTIRDAEKEGGMSSIGSQVLSLQRELKALESRKVVSDEALERVKHLKDLLSEVRGEAKNPIQVSVPVGGAGDIEKKFLDNIDKNVALRKQEAQVLFEIRGPQIEYMDRLKVLTGLLAAGKIKQFEFNEEVRKAGESAGVGLVGPMPAPGFVRQDPNSSPNPMGSSPNLDSVSLTRSQNEALNGLNATQATYNSLLMDYKALKDAGAISEAEWSRAVDTATLQALAGATSMEAGFQRAFASMRLEATNFAAVSEQAFGIVVDTATEALTQIATTGKVNFGDLARSAVAQLTQIIARLLIVQALSGIIGGPAASLAAGAGSQALSGNQGRAGGGTVQPGRAYLVGERGPEPFVPNRTGTIQPAGSAAAPPNVNVQVVNVSDPNEVPNAIQGGRADRAILNVVQRNASSVKQMLGVQ